MKTYPQLRPELVKAMAPHQVEAVLFDVLNSSPLMEIAKKRLKENGKILKC
ncbi:MAG: hypothetical protein M1445_06285 [Bacteroidetes bacterium]|nr:hypothetical protein [Bacteroidota bacterium]